MTKTYTRSQFLDFSRIKNNSNNNTTIPLPPGGEGLEKYSGEWNFETAAHLYRRSTFGADHQQIKEAADKSLEIVIDELFMELPLPSEPINFAFEDDPEVPIGESWINKPYFGRDNDQQNAQQQFGSRVASLRAWELKTILESGLNIRGKMTLFWHNHFVIQLSVVRDPNFVFKYINTLRVNALGNFKDLAALITVDPAMLRYLNGNQNNRNAPNENYAREFFELFTIGKGALAGPSDYSTFTEDDVVAAAKVFTGWRDVGYRTTDGTPAGSRYVNFLHDNSSKQFSHRFNNTIISNQAEGEYLSLVDLVFEQEEVSKFISRKLYRWFVYYDINDDVEAQIIEPMVALLRESNYDVAPVIKTLLSSAHFYNICSVGPMVKNPLDFFSSMIIQHQLRFPPNNLFQYNLIARLVNIFENLEMVYFEPPNVAGWKPYYQEPQFYRIWINAVTLTNRQNITNLIVSGNVAFGDYILTIDLLEYISKFDNPYDPNELIYEIARYIFPNSITEIQKDFLKEILIPGLPDFEWTVEYGDYVVDPENEDKRRSVLTKLRALFTAFFSMPEYYLS